MSKDETAETFVTGAFGAVNMQPTLLAASGSEMTLTKCCAKVVGATSSDGFCSLSNSRNSESSRIAERVGEEWIAERIRNRNFSLAENSARPGPEINRTKIRPAF